MLKKNGEGPPFVPGKARVADVCKARFRNLRQRATSSGSGGGGGGGGQLNLQMDSEGREISGENN